MVFQLRVFHLVNLQAILASREDSDSAATHKSSLAAGSSVANFKKTQWQVLFLNSFAAQL